MNDLIQIKAVVESTYKGIDISEKNRSFDYADARKVYAYIASKCTRHTRKYIGKSIKRHHSSITVAIQRCEDLMQTDKDFRDRVRFCMVKAANMLNKQTSTYKEKLDIVFKNLSNAQQEELYVKASEMYADNHSKKTQKIQYV